MANVTASQMINLIQNTLTGVFAGMNTEIFVGYSLLAILFGYVVLVVAVHYIEYFLTRDGGE